MAESMDREWVALDVGASIWERFFTPHPLVVVGTREESGAHDLAPKHLAMPMSWADHFGFVCSPTHATYRNAVRTKEFTVSFPRPNQVVLASLAAAPRTEDGDKPSLQALATVPATVVDGALLSDAYLHLECRLERVVEELGDNVLLIGRLVAARVASDHERHDDLDDQDLIVRAPLLAYLYPGRYAQVSASYAFPFHDGFSR